MPEPLFTVASFSRKSIEIVSFMLQNTFDLQVSLCSTHLIWHVEYKPHLKMSCFINLILYLKYIVILFCIFKHLSLERLYWLKTLLTINFDYNCVCVCVCVSMLTDHIFDFYILFFLLRFTVELKALYKLNEYLTCHYKTMFFVEFYFKFTA